MAAAASSATPSFTMGPSQPQPPPTLGFALNHTCLVTHSHDLSLHFYTTILGMRELFTYAVPVPIPASERADPSDEEGWYKLSYLAYPETEGQGVAEILANKGSMTGLLEVLYLSPNLRKDFAHPMPGTHAPTTLSHLGFMVPDTKVVESRLREHNISILKGVGKQIGEGSADPEEAFEAFAMAFGLGRDVERGSWVREGIMKGFMAMSGSGGSGTMGEGFGLEGVVMCRDPDGNVVEILERAK